MSNFVTKLYKNVAVEMKVKHFIFFNAGGTQKLYFVSLTSGPKKVKRKKETEKEKQVIKKLTTRVHRWTQFKILGDGVLDAFSLHYT
jgi:hypothetical protein